MGKAGATVLLLFLFVFAIFGLYWFSQLGLSASNSYLLLVLMGMLFIIAAMFVKKIAGDDMSELELPINRSDSHAVVALFIGVVPLLLLLGSNIFFSFVPGSVVTSMAPLASFQSTEGALTYNALSTATSPFGVFFIIGVVAPVIEELVLGWAFIWAGIALAYGLRKLLPGLDFGDNNKHFDFFIAMVFSIALFALLHYFNNTYYNQTTGVVNWNAFAFAATFRAFLNVMIFKLGNLGMMFSIGFHSTWNILTLPASLLVQALFMSIWGYVYMLIFVLIFFFAIVSIPKIWDEIKFIQRDFGDWE